MQQQLLQVRTIIPPLKTTMCVGYETELVFWVWAPNHWRLTVGVGQKTFFEYVTNLDQIHLVGHCRNVMWPPHR